MTTSNIQRVLRHILDRVDMEKMDQRYHSTTEIEFMAHPGFKNSSGKGGCGNGPDEFSLSFERQHELDFISRDLTGLMQLLNLQFTVF